MFEKTLIRLHGSLKGAKQPVSHASIMNSQNNFWWMIWSMTLTSTCPPSPEFKVHHPKQESKYSLSKLYLRKIRFHSREVLLQLSNLHVLTSFRLFFYACCSLQFLEDIGRSSFCFRILLTIGFPSFLFLIYLTEPWRLMNDDWKWGIHYKDSQPRANEKKRRVHPSQYRCRCMSRTSLALCLF